MKGSNVYGWCAWCRVYHELRKPTADEYAMLEQLGMKTRRWICDTCRLELSKTRWLHVKRNPFKPTIILRKKSDPR